MKKQVIEKLAALVTAAFGLVAALAWNSTIQEIFKKYYSGGGILANLVYAIIVTIIAVIVAVYVGKATERVKK